MDMWSAACAMFEMYTAQVLFSGRHNNEILKQMMDLRGSFPRRLLKKVGGLGEGRGPRLTRLDQSDEDHDCLTDQPTS